MKLRKALLPVTSTIAIAACTQQPETTVQENWLGESSVGTINGVDVPESLFRRLGLDAIQKTAEDMTPEERAAILQRLVSLRLVADDGERNGLHQERSIAAGLELARLQFLANAAVNRYLDQNPPREAELRELYEQRTQNLSGTEYRASHILVETEAEAIALIDELDGGADFATLAMEHSIGPTGPDGGDLNWFSPDRMVEPFSNAVQQLEVGTYTAAPVETQFGWHVIFLADMRDQQPPGLESMRDELTTLVQQQRVDAYLESLTNAADVSVE